MEFDWIRLKFSPSLDRTLVMMVFSLFYAQHGSYMEATQKPKQLWKNDNPEFSEGRTPSPPSSLHCQSPAGQAIKYKGEHVEILIKYKTPPTHTHTPLCPPSALCVCQNCQKSHSKTFWTVGSPEQFLRVLICFTSVCLRCCMFCFKLWLIKTKINKYFSFASVEKYHPILPACLNPDNQYHKMMWYRFAWVGGS